MKKLQAVREGVGSVFEGNHEVIVCPVNSKGIPNDIGVEFAQRYPIQNAAFLEFLEAEGELKLGRGYMVHTQFSTPKNIIYIPYKETPEADTAEPYIAVFAGTLLEFCKDHNFTNIGVPSFGVGEGQIYSGQVYAKDQGQGSIAFSDVKGIFEEYFDFTLSMSSTTSEKERVWMQNIRLYLYPKISKKEIQTNTHASNTRHPGSD